MSWDGDFWANRRFVVIANYTYTKSDISVSAGDTTTINGTDAGGDRTSSSTARH